MRLSRANRRRLWVYGSLTFGLAAFYAYQPMRIDLFPRRPPVNAPLVDPNGRDLFKPGARVAIVTAHPDDCEYYLGGLVARLAKSGAQVDLIVCTDGDRGYYPWENAARNRVVRRKEQMAAARAWKAHRVAFLGFPDGRLHPNSDVIDAIGRELRRSAPRWVLAFDGDYPPRVSHGDHRSSGIATFAAVQKSGAEWLMRFSTRAPNHVIDVSDFEDAQGKLLGLHTSQFSGEKLERVSQSVEADASEAGDRIGVTYGVALRCSPLPN